MIDSLESGYGMEELNTDRSKPVAQVDAQASKPDGDFLFGKEGLTFSDVLATINPLQHLPVISFIYREITGDVIKPIARIAGDALYGGPIGALAGAVDSAAEYAFGGDVGHTLIALVRDGKFPNSPHSADDTVLAQAPQKDGDAPEIDYPAQIAAVPVAPVSAAPLDGAAEVAPAQLAALPQARLVNRSGSAEALEPQLAAAPVPAKPTQTAEIPPARLINRSGTSEPAAARTGAVASLPVVSAQLAQAAAAPAAVQASTPAPAQTAATNAPAAMTISEAAAADETQSRGAQGGIARGGIGLSSFGVRPPASSLAAATVPVTAAGADQSSAVNSLTQLSATGLSRNGLPTAGAATPAAVMAQAQNAAAPGGDPSQAFGGSSLRPPRINNIAPRMPATYQAQNHTAVALPSRSAGASAARPLQAPMAPTENAAQTPAAEPASADTGLAPTAQAATATVVEQTAAAPAAIPDTMARALDKYEALMKSRRGDGVNSSY